MTPRLRNVLIAAAGLVVGGTGLGVALRQSGQALDPPMTCPEWAKSVAEATQTEPSIEWFVALLDGFAPPAAVGERILGDCANNTCTVEPQGCPKPVTYTYERSGAVNGWRLFKVRGPRYFAAGWRALATEQPSNVRFFRGYKELAPACLAHFTAAQCRALVNDVNPCWKRADGSLCRYGRLYGPGQGGEALCSPGAGYVPFVCEVTAGQRPEDVVGADFPEDEP